MLAAEFLVITEIWIFQFLLGSMNYSVVHKDPTSPKTRILLRIQRYFCGFSKQSVEIQKKGNLLETNRTRPYREPLFLEAVLDSSRKKQMYWRKQPMFINLGVPWLLAALWGRAPSMEQERRREEEKCKKRESRMAATASRDLWQSINWSPAIGVKILAIQFRC